MSFPVQFRQSLGMNQFTVQTDLDLPCSHEKPLRFHENKVIRIERGKDLTSDVQQVHWEGRSGGNVLRSYHVGDSVLLGIGLSITMRIPKDGLSIAVDFDDSDPIEPELGCAATTNLGLAVCSLFQGYLPLHGCGVSIQGHRAIIMAPSGTGKSTLLWKLLDDGAVFTSDDVNAVEVEKGSVTVYPSVSLHSKLSKSAILERGWNCNDFRQVCTGSKEHWIPIDACDRINTPGKLNAVFVLRPLLHPPSSEFVRITRVWAGEAISVLMANTQGLWAVRSFLNVSELMHRYCEMLRTTPLYIVQYSRSFEVLPNLVKSIQKVVMEA